MKKKILKCFFSIYIIWCGQAHVSRLFVSEAKTNADCQQPRNKKAHKKSFSLQRGFQAGIPNCSWELKLWCWEEEKPRRGWKEGARGDGKSFLDGGKRCDSVFHTLSLRRPKSFWLDEAVADVVSSRKSLSSSPSRKVLDSLAVVCSGGRRSFRASRQRLPAFWLWAVVLSHFWDTLPACRWRSSWVRVRWCNTM